MQGVETEYEEEVEAGEIGDDGDRPGVLVTYMAGAPEVIYLDGTDDEELPIEDLCKRVEGAARNGLFARVGNRRIVAAAVRSIGPAEDVDLPDVAIFSELESRASQILANMENVTSTFATLAGNLQALMAFQGQLQSAQAQLFEAVAAEGELLEDEEERVEQVPQKKGLKSLRRR